MQSVAILLFVLVTVFLVYQKYFAKRYAPITYPYKKVGNLMSGPEVAFYNALITAVDNRALVFAKVHMADVLMPAPNKDKKKWLAAFNRIARKHLDFVVCRPGTLEVLCIIEFDNGKELNKTKAERKVTDARLQNVGHTFNRRQQKVRLSSRKIKKGTS